MASPLHREGRGDTLLVCRHPIYFEDNLHLSVFMGESAGVSPKEGQHTNFHSQFGSLNPTVLVRCLPRHFSREGFSGCFLPSTVKSNIAYPRHSHFLLLGIGVREQDPGLVTTSISEATAQTIKGSTVTEGTADATGSLIQNTFGITMKITPSSSRKCRGRLILAER